LIKIVLVGKSQKKKNSELEVASHAGHNR